MKKILAFLLAAVMLLALTACAGQPTPEEGTAADEPAPTAPETEAETAPETAAPATAPAPAETGAKTLVVYFSATGNTKAVAEQIAALTGAELAALEPAEPYTADDLNYNDSDCRANREMNDPAARPALGGDELDLSGYDTVILGYPIWWGTMPRLINTFLDTHDLSGKVVLPFCTSGSSGVAQSVSDLRDAAPGAEVRDGLRAANAQDEALAAWLSENGLAVQGQK